MKNLQKSFAVTMVFVIIGCSQGTPGGPGTTAMKPVYGQTDNTFNLSVPMMASTLQQGERADVSIGIKRAKNFDEDVSLKFADIPEGVTIEPANPVIKHGDTESKIAFKAGADAVVGEFKIKVTGHPEKGTDAVVDFKLTVSPKDSFTINSSRTSTSLKQGETKTVSLGIKRQKTFDQEVTLKFGEMPTGVTVDPSSPVIKIGETETRVTFTGADDAALGDFEIKMTGHPSHGDDASNAFKLTVVKQ